MLLLKLVALVSEVKSWAGFDANHKELFGLGVSHTSRFRSNRDVTEIGQAIEHFTRALDLTPDGHPDLPLRHNALGASYTERFQRLGDMNDLEKALKHNTHALDLTPDGHPDMPRRHHALGVSYTERFRRLGDMKDLEKALEHFTRALDLTPDGHPDLSLRHDALGMSYSHLFGRLGDMNDLEKALEHNARAFDLTPNGHPHLPRRHHALGASYTHRFDRLGNMNDLEKALEHFTHALDLTPDGHPDLPHWHDSLGVSYRDRFLRLGDMNDLERSLEHDARALDLTPHGHPRLPLRHNALGASYTERFRRLGDVTDLEKALEHFTHALDLTPDGHPDMSLRHHALGVSYIDRFNRMGDVNDLEKALEHLTHALDLTPDGHPDLPLRHDALGESYKYRFERLGDISDLKKGLQHNAHSLDLTPDGHPDLPLRHHVLGVSYKHRFERLGDMDDLEKALEYFTRALDLTPDGHPDLPRRHNALGASYRDRFQRLGDMKVLEKAVEHDARALDLTPDGDPRLPRRHDALGASYTERFQRLGDMNDLEKALEHSTRALDLTSDGHPSLPSIHRRLAFIHLLQFERTNNLSQLHNSLASFRHASQLPIGSPRDKFQYALDWARHAVKHPQLNCLEAYNSAINLLPQFVWLGATTAQRYQDLSATENLALNATSAAIRHAHPRLALEWLEHTRCVVWNQNTMLRSPLDELHSIHPDLATQLETVSMQLDDVGSHKDVLTPSPEDPEQIGKQRRRLAQQYSDLLAEARALPGFGDLLRPMKSDGLIRAARHGPIVAINCNDDRCDALIILPHKDDIIHLPLPYFTAMKAQSVRSDLETSLLHKGLRQRGVKLLHKPVFEDRMPSVLLALWNDIVKPVLDHLGFTNDVPTEGLPHITWCPTGALSFLPLHAAGNYDQPGSRVFDYAISSYTPTLSSFLASTPSKLTHTSRVLAIGQPNTPGHTPLPGATTELASLRAHTQNRAAYTELVGSHATRDIVLDAMAEHDWVHLACHAHQNIVDPTKSGFFLHNGTLDLASISRRSFKNKGLAFLSACQTATGDEKLPDEALHLASGMLMAGYPSVIATMWSVVDADAPFVADNVYAELMEEGTIGNGEAGRALHHAVAKLRDKVGDKQFARWVPYIHIGS